MKQLHAVIKFTDAKYKCLYLCAICNPKGCLVCQYLSDNDHWMIDDA